MTDASYQSLIREKQRVAVSSVFAALFLTAIKLFVGLWTASLGLISDAAHSGLDFLAALMTWFSVSLSDRPADTSPPYGHYKIDNLAALVETLLLGATAAWIVYESIERLFFKTVLVTVTPVSFGVLVVCISVDYLRCRALSRAAKKTGSAALEANAYHFLSDIATSVVVLLGLVGIALGYQQADALCAIAVAFFILSIAGKLGKKAIDALTDRVPDDHIEQVRRAAMTVPGVSDIYDVRVRHAGNRHFIDLKAGISSHATLSDAHALSDSIEKQIKASFDNADVLVHLEPNAPHSAGLTETIFALAHQEGINVHSIQILHTSSGLHCTMHLEWPADMQLGKAHSKATELEEQIKERFPRVASVRSHLECSIATHASPCSNITDAHAPFIETIRRVATDTSIGVCDIRDIHIMETDGAWDISLVCGVTPDISLCQAHRIATDIEKRISRLAPHIASVHVHTEPQQ